MSSMNDDEDKKLVRQTLQGESRAFEMIVRKYQQPLLNYVGRMVGERELALDLTQDALVKAFVALRSYKPEYRFNTWLFRIASNLLVDHWRKKKLPTTSISAPGPDADCPAIDVPDDRPSVLERLEAAEARQKIETALAKIPAALREVFVWRHVSGLSYEEIAEIKDLPVGTIKNRVFQAKEMIRRKLESPA
jgi:RNA polymerase sigma-70 factor (ECF subfamily)